MTVLSKAAFFTKWGDTLGAFQDNTTREISESDLRDFATDIKDSCTFDAGLNYAVIEIGDWNMDTTASVTVDLSEVVDAENVRIVSVVIRKDNIAGNYDTFVFPFIDASGNIDGWAGMIDDTSLTDAFITLYRRTSGTFDAAVFDQTSYNRGWITIGYI